MLAWSTTCRCYMAPARLKAASCPRRNSCRARLWLRQQCGLTPESEASSFWVWGHYRRAPCTLPGRDPAALHCWGEHHLESHRSLESENSRGEGMFLKGWNKRLALMLLQPAWKTRSKWKPWSLDRGIIILDLEESLRIFHGLWAVLVRWSR